MNKSLNELANSGEVKMDELAAKLKVTTDKGTAKIQNYVKVLSFIAAYNPVDWNIAKHLKEGKEAFIITYDFEEGGYDILEISGPETYIAPFDLIFADRKVAEKCLLVCKDDLNNAIAPFRNNSKLDADAQVIINKVKEILGQQGSVTTLDIKRALREDGYRITQEEVSTAMQHIMHVLHLKVSSAMTNGNLHLVFSEF